MLFRVAADVVVAVHAAFVLFVVAGALLVLRWPRLMWVHVPAAIWGASIEFLGWICPLTPLENHLRRQGGSSAYRGDFIADLNPASLEVLTGCKVEPSLARATEGARYQFERQGYFTLDPDSTSGAPVFNRTVSLKDSWEKKKNG